MTTVDLWCLLESIAVILIFTTAVILGLPRYALKQGLIWIAVNLIINLVFIYYL